MEIRELLKKYGMKPHEENGSYSECNAPYDGPGRAPSGSCYYYTSPGGTTLFHRIDCDEYWCWHAGSPLEVWIVGTDGALTVRTLGLGPDAEPVIRFPKGVIFGSRNREPEGEGTFFTCVTVPRFSYDGFELIGKEEVIGLCPAAAPFWD